MTKSLVGSRCEQHDVRLLAWTRWNAEAERWKLAGSHDIAYCRDCKDVILVETGKPFRKKGHFPPNLGGGNDLRAEHAHAAIAAYKHFMNDGLSDDEFELGFFLADLLHYCDRYGSEETFNEALATAERNYQGETSDNLADALGVAEVVQVGANGSEKVVSVAARSAPATTEK